MGLNGALSGSQRRGKRGRGDSEGRNLPEELLSYGTFDSYLQNGRPFSKSLRVRPSLGTDIPLRQIRS